MLFILLLASQLQQPHFRNTFATAAESAIDTVMALDIRSSPAGYDAALKSAQAALTNLKAMATEEGEPEVVTQVNSLFFTVQACHIQATDNADLNSCERQIDHARTRAMFALGKHKANGVWIDGPPA